MGQNRNYQNEHLCADLAAVAWGDSIPLLPPGADSAVARLPVWGWIAGVDRGAKTRLAPDSTYPTRLGWTVVSGRAEIFGSLVVMPRRLGSRAVLGWTLTGPQKQCRSGQTSVQVADAWTDPTVTPTSERDLPGEALNVSPQIRSKALRWRAGTQGAGESALWSWVSTVERMALAAISSQAKQLAWGNMPSTETVFDAERQAQMAFDAATRAGWAAMKARKLIRTAAITGRVDPQRYTSVAVRSRVITDIQRLIGDVHQGGKIRSIYAAGSWADSDTFIAAVRAGAPGIGARSAAAAVTVQARLILATEVTSVAMWANRHQRTTSENFDNDHEVA